MGAYDLVNLNKRTNVAPGIAAFALVAKKSDFTTLAGIAVPTTDTPLGDTVKIKSAHVFAPGKAWSRWSLAKDKNQMEASGDGDPSFRQLKQTATLFVPGSYAEAHAIMAALLNEDLIVLVRDSTCASNMYYQLGNECSPATMSPKFTTSTTASGVKGYEVTVEYSGPCVQLYEAAVGTIMVDGGGETIEMSFAATLVVANSGVTVTAPALDPQLAFAFPKQAVLGPADWLMLLHVGGVLELTVSYNESYMGKPFTFTDAAGVEHLGYFTPATVNFA